MFLLIFDVIFSTADKREKAYVALASDWEAANELAQHWLAIDGRWLEYLGYKITKREEPLEEKL